MGYIVCPKCKNGCAKQNNSKPKEITCKICGQFIIVEPQKLSQLLDNEIKIIRLTCRNVLKQPMYGKTLQDTVIFHLRNFVKNIEEELLRK